MDNLQTFISRMRWRVGSALFIGNLTFLLTWMFETIWHVPTLWIAISLSVLILISTAVMTILITSYSTKPFQIIRQAILHLAPDGGHVPAPDSESLRLGREMVGSLLNHLYQLASATEQATKNTEQTSALANEQIASRLPLPLFVFDKNLVLKLSNDAVLSYLGLQADAANGKSLDSLLNMLFPDEKTLEAWLKGVSGATATASQTWEHVRLGTSSTGPKIFDLAAYYNRDNPAGYELLLVLFDHSLSYGHDDQALSFVSLAVHELRTPLMLLRGYIEALEDDLGGKLPPEDNEFLERTEAAGQQLAAFVNNVLNMARVEDNQFVVQLREENWPGLIKTVVNDYSLRARLADVTIETDVPADLPSVGIDRLSMYEVLGNLIDNALKYSPKKSIVTIKTSLTTEGSIETTVQDTGIGVPDSVIPHLFDKFYRSHRSRDQVGGTGLGLYLCRTIVNAHGGHIWVRSHEGQGSTFGFTISPYNKLAGERQAKSEDFTRTAYGWIKNHSLYRR